MGHPLLPLEPPFRPDVAAVLARYPHRDGYLLTLFRVFANSRRFLEKGVANLLDRDSPLSLRQRELVILRVCANTHCEYEWGVHVTAFAGRAGLDADQVAATRLADASAPCWDDEARLVIRAVDELCTESRITSGTYEEIRARFTVEQQLEILALCGNYHTVSFVANTAALEGEAFGATFPTSDTADAAAPAEPGGSPPFSR